MIIEREQFRKTYIRSVYDVMNFWTPSMQNEISRHNVGWRKGVTNFKNYLLASELRYWIAINTIQNNGGFSSYCDIGGFFGAYTLTLSRLGINVVMTEALGYYSDSFLPLFDYLSSEGVDIINHDPFEDSALVDRKFDVVSAMAILEHYPHSHKRFLEFMTSIVAPTGRLYIEVPNIAYWPRRWNLLRGITPLTPVEDIYKSEVPFIGHHHEFTMCELYKLAELAGFKVLEENHFNYSFVGPLFKRFISDPMLTLMSYRKSMRECLAVLLSSSNDIIDSSSTSHV